MISCSRIGIITCLPKRSYYFIRLISCRNAFDMMINMKQNQNIILRSQKKINGEKTVKMLLINFNKCMKVKEKPENCTYTNRKIR